MRRSIPNLGCCATENKKYTYTNCSVIDDFFILVNKISSLLIYIWKLGKIELYSSVTVIFTQLHPKVYPPPPHPLNRKCHKFYFM
jgi:hypothetical protein